MDDSFLSGESWRLFYPNAFSVLVWSLVPAPDPLDLVVIPHEGNDVSRRVADERGGDLGLIRIDATLGRRLPWTEDRDFAADVAVGEEDLRSDAHDCRVDLGRIEH